MTKIQHKRSSVLVSGAAKAPTSAQLDFGELGINFNTADPQIFIKDSSGSVISILSSYAPLSGATFTGDVNFDGEAVIKGDSTNSGTLTLNSETNAKYVKLQAPANAALTSYTLTLPGNDGSSGNVLTTDGSGGLSWALSAMSTADKNKLDGIETGATADQVGSEIKSLYEGESNTNAFTDAEKNKLSGIAAGAEVNVKADFNATSGDAQILNKPTIPTNNNQLTNGAGYITSADGGNAQTLDGVDSSQFLRSDASDTSTGVLTLQPNANRTLILNRNVSPSNYYNDLQLEVRATNGTAGIGLHRNGYSHVGIYHNSLNQLKFDMNSGTVTLNNNTGTIWGSGNDGAGSGLDADHLDGFTWNSSGKDLRGSDIYADSWFRNYNSGQGLYNQATGAHFYSDGDGIWNLTGNTQNQSVQLKFRGTHAGNIEGWMYASGDGWFGWLNDVGGWKIKSYIADSYSPNIWFQEDADTSWTGNPVSNHGKIEYHSDRFYIAAGSNSSLVCQFRRAGTDVAHFDNSGNLVCPAVYDSANTGYYIDPASHSNLYTARFQGNAVYIRGGDPTLYFQDTNNDSAMLHNNSNLLYVLRGGIDTTSWSQVGGQWPFIFYLGTNNAKCGGSFEAVGDITANSSDRRLKQNFKPIESALDKVQTLNGLFFDWKPEVIDLGFTPAQMEDNVGLIAQEVQAVLPQAVKPAPFDQTWDNDLKKTVSTSGEDYITVQYERLVPLLVEAIKELTLRLTTLENKE